MGNYVLGSIFSKTDHKPLITLFTNNTIISIPLHPLFSLQFAKLSYMVEHTTSKLLFTADAMACAPIQ